MLLVGWDMVILQKGGWHIMISVYKISNIAHGSMEIGKCSYFAIISDIKRVDLTNTYIDLNYGHYFQREVIAHSQYIFRSANMYGKSF